MLFTRETDYALRIIRVLKDGGTFNVKSICQKEMIPEAFTYKILRKLQKTGVVNAFRGTAGGYYLMKPVAELTLYDVILMIEPDFALTHCMNKECIRNPEKNPCGVHRELVRIQNNVIQDLKRKSLDEIL